MEKAHTINNGLDTSQNQAVKLAGTEVTSTYISLQRHMVNNTTCTCTVQLYIQLIIEKHEIFLDPTSYILDRFD
jgi:hypothetical protein